MWQRIKLMLTWLYDQFVYPLFATNTAHERVAQRAHARMEVK